MQHIIKTTYDLYDIQNAIDKSNPNDEIIISKGTYYTRPLDLKSNLTITLEEGTTIIFTELKEYYYEQRFIRFEGVECFGLHPLIYGKDLDNVTLRGKGKLIGNGQAWWKYKKLQAKACDKLCYAEANGIKIEDRITNLQTSYLRPDFLELVSCNNVLLEGFKIINSPMWTLHPVYCNNVIIRNVNIYSDGPNTDGIDPDSCDNVLIERCLFETGDDCIAINSGLNEDGRRVNKPCTNVTIKNCKFIKGHAALAIGSGMSGGVRNIYFQDSVIDGVERGIRVKSLPGRGGYVEDIYFKNISISNVKDGIELTMDYPSSTSVPLTKLPPKFNNFTFDNIEISNADNGIKALGLEDSHIGNVTFNKIKLFNVKKEKDLKYID
jgi:polygalacturonase